MSWSWLKGPRYGSVAVNTVMALSEPMMIYHHWDPQQNSKEISISPTMLNLPIVEGCSGSNVSSVNRSSRLENKGRNFTVKPLRAKFLRENIKHIFTFHVIPLHWYDTGGWNPSSNKTRTYPFYIVNIMAAGVLATQGAGASGAMILT